MRVDLNADLGEGVGGPGHDEALLDLVTSANVACGGHAGDAGSMRAVAAAALARGVVLGAHVSYVDRGGFGRQRLDVPPGLLRDQVREQLEALRAAAADVGAEVEHVKAHGALYHAASADPAVGDAVLDAVADVDVRLTVLALAGSPFVVRARERGFRVAREAFADRGYAADGTLVPRGAPGALVEAPEEAAARVVDLVRAGVVTAVDGRRVSVAADSVCVHGDGASARRTLQVVRAALDAAGVEVRSFLR